MTATVSIATALAALRDVCDDVRAAGTEDTVDRVPASLVASPTSTEEVAAVLRAAAFHGLVVVPRGAGTKLSWGRPPASVDLIVDMGRMNRVLEHAAGDLVVRVQAGTPLAALQEVVARGGQRLALDETVAGATVGGTIAAATSGPGRVLTGTVRDLLIGVTFVRADGVVAKGGGRVVKNVAGYDLCKLLAGSFGTLGVITEAIFRLHPLPAARAVVATTVDSAEDSHRLAQAVTHSQVVPSAVEIDWPAGSRATLAVLLEGVPAGVRERAAITQALLGGQLQERPEWWSTYPWSRGETGLKLTFALSGLAEVLAEAHALSVSVRGSVGAGVLYGAMAPDSDLAPIERLRTVCARHGGSLVVVDAPAAVKDAVDVWGPIPALDLMRSVKNQFDPGHRLAPGRFVGDI